MDRIRDSIRVTCSSPFRPSTALSFKRTPTCQINEEDGPADTATLQDRAARKEMERVRLRKLLNQGKKKRRRLNGDKLPTNGASLGPVDDFRCQREGPHVPRKSRSVGYRRKSKSWKLIGLRLFSEQIELPIPSPIKDEKLPQNELEIEFEIAEVLSGLKTQVSSPSELLNNDLEKIPVEDEPKIKLERSGCYLRRSELSSVLPESTESKPPVKFIIDLNEPPPLESSLEGDKMEQLTTYSEDEMKVDPEEATVTRFVLPWKMEVNGEVQDLDLGSSDGNNNGRKQLIQKKQEGYSCTSIETDLLGPEIISPTQGISFLGNLNSIQHGKQGFKFYSHNINQESNTRRVSNLKIKDQVHDPLQSGRTMPGPLVFPQNQTRTTVMASHPLSHASNRNERISYPLRAPFLSVLPRNIYTNDGQNGEKNNQPLPFLDRKPLPSQMCLPIEAPHTTQAIADNRTLTGQTNMFPQTLFPLHSRSVVLMPSASSGGGGGGGGGGGQWKYATKHVLKSVHAQCSSSNEAAGQALTFSIPHNHVAVPGFLDKVKFGSQILPADPGLLHRHSEMIQRINQADSTLTAGNSTSWIKQSSFVLKSCSNISSAPNCNLSFSNHKAVNASQLKRVTTTDKQHQQPTAAEVSNSFIYDRSPALQNPQLKLTIPSSHIHT